MVNKQRIVDEFGGGADCGGTHVQGGCALPVLYFSPISKGVRSGSSLRSVAILTMKIRSLAEHLAANPRDIHSRRGLRGMVMNRKRLLKYFKREKPDEYDGLLADLGLERGAVEGEIRVA